MAPGSPVATGGFVPWSVPAAAGLGVGVCMSAGLPAAAVAALVGAASLAAVLMSVVLGRRGALGLAPLGLLAMSVGAARHEAWEARPDPVSPFLGKEVVWRGVYDGEWFLASDPVVARLALVSREPVEPSRLKVTGTARRASGKRNPGGFDHAAYLARRGVTAQLFAAEVSREPSPEGRGLGARQRLARGVAVGLPPDRAGLQLAMTLGLRDDLTREDRESFRASGLAHVLALSGLHFGVLVAVAGRVLRPLGRRRWPVLILVVALFVTVVGPSPSVVRAAAMAFAALVAQTSGVGRLEPWPVLALSACVSLLVQPQMLFDLSFQLSYLALVGLLGMAGPLAGLLGAPSRRSDPLLAELPGAPRGGLPRRVRVYVAHAMAASVAAQLPSLSLVAGTFGAVPPLAPIVNLVGVPLSAVLVPLGFLAGLLGLVWEPLAATVNLLAGPLAGALIALADLGARLPLVAWPEVRWLGHLCWAAFCMVLAAAARRKLDLRRLLAVALVAATVPQVVGGAQRPPDVWFLDVGQGDATLVRLPGGHGVLIDGGGTPFSDFDVGAAVVVPALRALGVQTLDLIIATHPDSDHVEGLLTVVRSLPVGALVTGPPAPESALDQELRSLAAELDVPVHVAVRGEAMVLGSSGLVRLEVLHPPAGRPREVGNESSVVALLRFRGQPAALLLADVGSVTEDDLALPRVHVLKVGHHGSRFSTSPELLAATRPALAVVSVGENRYGHPHPSVLARLADHGVPVLTTLEAGAIRLALEGFAVGR